MFTISIQFVAVCSVRGRGLWIQHVNDIIFNDQRLYSGIYRKSVMPVKPFTIDN